MSQHIDPTPKQTDIDTLNNKIGNVGNTDLQSQITSLNSKFTSLQMGSVQYNYTVAGNGQVNTNLKSIIDASKPSGATVLGIVGFTSNEVTVVPVSVRYANSNYSLQFKNISSESRTNNFEVYYLYIVL